VALQGPIPVEFGVGVPVRGVRGWRVRAGAELRALGAGAAFISESYERRNSTRAASRNGTTRYTAIPK